MYDRKIYLYFALAITGFLLWTAWQKDYAPKPQVAAQVAPSAIQPVLTPAAPGSVTTGEKNPQDRFIQVKTDALDIKIDKVGGNIVSLKLLKYPVAYETPQIPVSLLTDDTANYYVTESGFDSKNGLETSKTMFESPQSVYQLDPNKDDLAVDLTWKGNNITVKKTYVFKRGKYDINLNHALQNNANEAWQGNLFAQIKRRGLSDENNIFGLHTYRGAAISSPADVYEKISYSKMDKENLNRVVKNGWLAMQQRYFVSALVPNLAEPLQYFSSVSSIGPTDKPADKIYTIGFKTPELTVPPHSVKNVATTLYSGPEIADVLKQVAPNLDRVIDYGWLSIFSVAIFKVMEWIHQFVKNWGVAIILVTVMIKLLFYKLSETSYRSMARMRNLQPRLLALKDKFGDDRQKLSQATMELYKKEKVNPLGGCLPMVIQIPVFIALYYVLIESVQLRQAPFIFWIHDLSVKDPFYVLPILMGLSWMMQQKLNPPPPDPVQAKMMMLFPVVFTVLFATFPAGLVLYWIVNNCLSILQQWYIMRKVENEGKKSLPKTKTKTRVSSSR
ncbi:MAG: membrane protein insertase YidC [Gammaproteobacteria bacterium]|nr:membrane protein insertase YidC [Gammaproteobacteria bacterium]